MPQGAEGVPGLPGSGRATYWGSSKGPIKAGNEGEILRPPIEEMAKLQVGTIDVRSLGSMGDSRRRRDRFLESNYRPSHISDKRGISFWG